MEVVLCESELCAEAEKTNKLAITKMNADIENPHFFSDSTL